MRLLVGLSFLILCCQALTGDFTTLGYNVAGLIEFVSSAVLPRARSHREISTLLNKYDIVNVQEDFNYHTELYNGGNNHEFRTKTTGSMGFGSGLNTLSRFPISTVRRQRWGSCRVADCLTPKGFDMIEVSIAEGVVIHVYNLHAQAGTFDGAINTRKENFLLLGSFIERHSKDHPVLVYGDYNCRYTMDRESVNELITRGFTDVWHELIRSPTILDLPEEGSDVIDCSIDDDDIVDYTSPFCEDIDKILYRSSDYVTLIPTAYKVLVEELTDETGENLSDHPGIFTNWSYFTDETFFLTKEFGSSKGGKAFSDVSFIKENLVEVIESIEFFSNNHLVGIQVTYANGAVVLHGSKGSISSRIVLENEEVFVDGRICLGGIERKKRVYHIEMSTSLGNTFSFGKRTGECQTIDSVEGFRILGFHGRKGKELDRIGFVLKQIE